MLAVSLVRIVLIAWGKKDMVVQNAAARPTMVMRFTVTGVILYKIRHPGTRCGKAAIYPVANWLGSADRLRSAIYWLKSGDGFPEKSLSLAQ